MLCDEDEGEIGVETASGKAVMAFKRFEDILAWQQARTLTGEIFAVTNTLDELKADRAMAEKLQSAAISVMSKISYGFATKHTPRFIDNLYESLGYACEVRTLLYVCGDQEKIPRRVFERLSQMAQICVRMIRELITLCEKQVKSRKETNEKQQTSKNKAVKSDDRDGTPSFIEAGGIAHSDILPGGTGELERPDMADIYDYEGRQNSPDA